MILGGLGVLIVIVICYYFVSMSNNYDYSQVTTSLNIIDGQNENEKEIIIHIIGCVNNEGIVRLKEGARVIDAIESAGGATNEANLNKINLAYVLSDGQKIVIPNKNDETNIEIGTYDGANSEEYDFIIGQNEAEQIKININTADKTALETLPGIGASTAEKIIQYRRDNGRFEDIEDIKNVSGIGEAKFNAIKDRICI